MPGAWRLRPAIGLPVLVAWAFALCAEAEGHVVAGWGANFNAELGAGYRSGNVTSPVEGAVRGAVKVVSAYHTSYALMPSGVVLGWGLDGAGEIGDGSRAEKVEPTPARISGVTDFAAAGGHAVALKPDGTVWTWGGNSFGQLGNGTRDPIEGTAHTLPQKVPGLSGVARVFAGGADDAALKTDGTLCLWGENTDGQVGNGTTSLYQPRPLCPLREVAMAYLGGLSSLGGHTFVKLTNGQVLGFGDGERGQLGIGTALDAPTPVPVPALRGASSIAPGLTQTLAVIGGQLESTGADGQHELGYVAPERCPGSAPKTTRPCSKFFRPVGLQASEASAGLGFGVARDGEAVYGWGSNSHGQLGDGTETDKAKPVRVKGITGAAHVSAGEYFTLALAQAAAEPSFDLTPGVRSLTAEWADLPGIESWQIAWRTQQNPSPPWSPYTTLPSTQHAYTISGLSPGVAYEVRLRRVESTFGYRIGLGVPLAATVVATAEPQPSGSNASTPPPEPQKNQSGSKAICCPNPASSSDSGPNPKKPLAPESAATETKTPVLRAPGQRPPPPPKR